MHEQTSKTHRFKLNADYECTKPWRQAIESV